MGFKTILTEGARHIMGWRCPNYVYSNDFVSEQSLLLRNYALSDDIAFRFGDRNWSGWPLTAEKFKGWIDEAEGDYVGLFMDYETFGEHTDASTGIFDFKAALPGECLKDKEFKFYTPSEVAAAFKPVSELSVPNAISWADEERDLTAWLGNELQNEAFSKLYGLQEKLSILNDPVLWSDYGHLQESDHFYYMCTKFFTGGDMHKYFNPYNSPYEAFINYMNVLSDFIIRVNDAIAVK